MDKIELTTKEGQDIKVLKVTKEIVTEVTEAQIDQQIKMVNMQMANLQKRLSSLQEQKAKFKEE